MNGIRSKIRRWLSGSLIVIYVGADRLVLSDGSQIHMTDTYLFEVGDEVRIGFSNSSWSRLKGWLGEKAYG